LFSPEIPAGGGVYDYIFCRNLLIYFDPSMQTKALQRLGNLLAPNGLLFVGPAEQNLLTDHGFEPARIPQAFAGRKTRPEPKYGLPMKLPAAQVPPARGPSRLAAREITEPTRGEPARARATTMDGLTAARQFADAGRFEEAARLCQLHLQNHGPSAQAFFLLGLVSDAQGSDEAANFYRKALYLEPNHYDSLLHLAFLFLKDGNSTRARACLNRAGRLHPEIEPQAES
jgi:chemotaxis protein methyltransferase WspC